MMGLALFSILGGIFLLADDGQTASVSEESVGAFRQFVREYNKNYSSLEESNYRLGVFHTNLLTIQEHNQKGLSWKMGVNKFADLTWEEFQKGYLIQDPEPNEPFDGPVPELGAEEKDWVKEGKVTPVKDQGQCGSCYAFGGMASIESAWAMHTGNLTAFSEKEIIDCSNDWGNTGCKSGYIEEVYNYVIDEGISKLSDYPYQPKAEKCTVDKTKARFGLVSYNRIKPIDMSGFYNALKQQPISFCFDCRKDFHLYNSGVYKGEDGCGTAKNHCMLATGWGFDKDLKSAYIRTKNSWGLTWGEKGFVRFYLKGGSGTCGMANRLSTFPEVKKN